MHDSVTVHIAAPIEEVWDLVSDVTRVGEWSPETFEAEWTHGYDGPEEGARFRGHVRRNGIGPVYWTPCQVTRCVENEIFQFAVGPPGRAINNWRYELAPSPEGGTDVTESFRLSSAWPVRIYWALAGWRRRKTNIRGMRTTLERMKAELEGSGT